jgi:HK97 gp10 family phage protein
MVGEIKTGIKGAAAMERLLKQLGPEVASKIGDQSLRAAAKPIIAEAKRLVPVRTGKLRDSLTVVIERKRKDDDTRLAVIGFKKPTSRIAHLIEFGTSKMPAHPFLRPALDSKADEALQEMGKVMARGITREAKKLAKPTS